MTGITCAGRSATGSHRSVSSPISEQRSLGHVDVARLAITLRSRRPARASRSSPFPATVRLPVQGADGEWASCGARASTWVAAQWPIGLRVGVAAAAFDDELAVAVESLVSQSVSRSMSEEREVFVDGGFAFEVRLGLFGPTVPRKKTRSMASLRRIRSGSTSVIQCSSSARPCS